MRLTAIPSNRGHNATHLSLGEVVAIVLARGVADVVERLLKACGVSLNESNTQVQRLLLVGLPEVRETTWDVLDRAHDMAALLERGGGKREREKRGKNEQTGCNHFELISERR